MRSRLSIVEETAHGSFALQQFVFKHNRNE
jgi:hypothetical protein